MNLATPSPSRGVVARLAAAVVLCAGLSSAQSTFTVPGTHATIQAAVDAASGPTEVYVLGGVHDAFVVSSKSDLTLIGQGTPIVSSASGDAISIASSTRVSLSGFLVSQPSGAGIVVSVSQDVVLEKCETVQTGDAGLVVADTSGLLVTKCTLSASGGHGVLMTGSASSGVIERCKILGTGANRDGVRIDDARGVIVERNKIEGTAQHGIHLGTSMHCHVARNAVKAAGATAVRVDGDNHVVERNKLFDPGGRGVDVRGSGNVVTRNKVLRPGAHGIYVGGSALGNVFTRNAVVQAKLDAVRADVGGTTFLDNKINAPNRDGMLLGGLGLHTVQGNAIRQAGGDALVIAAGATNSMIVGNKIAKSDRGLVVEGDDTLVSDTKSVGNTTFDLVDDASGTTVIGCTFELVGP